MGTELSCGRCCTTFTLSRKLTLAVSSSTSVCVIDLNGGVNHFQILPYRILRHSVLSLALGFMRIYRVPRSADAFNLNHINRTHDDVINANKLKQEKNPRERERNTKKCYPILDLINEHLSFAIGFWLQLPVLEGVFDRVFIASE